MNAATRGGHFDVLTYNEVVERLPDRAHILLGNGFSIACDPVFSYRSLCEVALGYGLSSQVQQIFEHVGVNDFERAIRLLDDAHWVASVYGLVEESSSQMRRDGEVVKEALVKAVAACHLPHCGCILDQRKDCAAEFLNRYSNLFCTNYDLLLYWVTMHGGKRWNDGFAEDENAPDSQNVVFSRLPEYGMFFLHGALHMHYGPDGRLRKHCWRRSGQRLMELVREGMEHGQYPLFVAEGSSGRKLVQIQRSPYLWHCYQKLREIRGSLVVFGHSLNETDAHIAAAIAENPHLEDVYVGLHGDATSRRATYAAASERLIASKELRLWFYDSASAAVWDYAGNSVEAARGE